MSKNPQRDMFSSLRSRAEAAGSTFSSGPAAALTDLEQSIIACLRSINGTDVLDLSQILGIDAREVQNALHNLDDLGYVLMRSGWYRLSEAAKRGKI